MWYYKLYNFVIKFFFGSRQFLFPEGFSFIYDIWVLFLDDA